MAEETGGRREEPDDNGEAVGRAGASTPYELARRRLDVDWGAYGREIRRLREERGWSLRKLSRESGVPLTTLANIEKGETERPDYVVACALSHTFGFSNPGALLGVPATGGSQVRAMGARVAGAEGPAGGGVRLDALVEQLLRGVWRAQEGRTPAAEAPAPPTRRGAISEVISLAVGVVVLVEPPAEPVVSAAEAVTPKGGK